MWEWGNNCVLGRMKSNKTSVQRSTNLRFETDKEGKRCYLTLRLGKKVQEHLLVDLSIKNEIPTNKILCFYLVQVW